MENHSVTEQLWLTKLVLALTVEAAGAMATGEEGAIVAATVVEVVGLEGEDGRGDIRITLHYLSSRNVKHIL